MPFFSIIMSCYNADKYIEHAINSVLNQTYKNWELIIINDGSKDNSLKIINKFQKRDKKIKAIHLKKNLGQAYARNLGIKISKGKWISILDADDIYSQNKLAVQSGIIRNLSKDYVLIGTSCVLINKKGKRINNRLHHYPKKTFFLKNNLYRNSKFPPHSSIVYKKSAIKKIGLFDERFKKCEDYDLWLRLSSIGNFTSTNKTYINYRMHDSNTSNLSGRYDFSSEVESLLARVLHISRLKKLEKELEKKYSFNELLILTKNNLQENCFYNKNKKINKIKKNFFTILLNFENIKFIFLLLLERYGIYRPDKILLKNFIKNN